MWYLVQEGDSLYSIARKFNTTVDGIMNLNNLTDTRLEIGQKLLIKAKNDLSTSTNTPQTSNSFTDGIGYVKPDRDDITLLQKGEEIAVFKETITSKKLKIYSCRDAYFFMSKMSIDENRKTSLCLKNDVGRCIKHVNTYEIPFFVLPHNNEWADLGDLGVVVNTYNNKACYAIFADWGPKQKSIKATEFSGDLGEGSIALGQNLDITYIKPNPLKGFQKSGIVYIVFKNSGKGQGVLRSINEIKSDAYECFRRWGGTPQVDVLIRNHFSNIEGAN